MSETKIEKFVRLHWPIRHRYEPDYEYHVRDFLAYACEPSFVQYLEDLERDAQLHALTPDQKDAELIELREKVEELRILVHCMQVSQEGPPKWPAEWVLSDQSHSG